MEEHITVGKESPFPGRFKISNSPWLKEPFEEFANDLIKDLVVKCSAQSAKTMLGMGCVAWVVPEQPGPAMWVTSTGDKAKEFMRERLGTFFEKCAPVAKLFPKNRHHKSLLAINFPSMSLTLTGAQSDVNLQSKPCRYLFLDECRNYPPGAYETVLKRTRAWKNCKRVTISTPGDEGEHVDRAFKLGDQRTYHVPCPSCAHLQALVWKQLKWDTNDTTCPAGEWNYDKLEPTIRYECISCKAGIPDKVHFRKSMARGGVYVKGNPNAPRNRASFQWNALLPPWVNWRDLVEEFLEAMKAYRQGVVEPLKVFWTESMGEGWNESYFFETQEEAKTYEVNSEWKDEKFRVMTIDVQAESTFYYVVRAWSLSGESRRIEFGRAVSWDELRAKQAEHKIRDRLTLIDSGYDTKEVYRACCRWGWIALKGEDKEYYPHLVKKGESTITVRRSYSPEAKGDPEIGRTGQGRRFASLVRWSNPTIKDRLKRLVNGKGAPWLDPDKGGKLEQDYHRQMRSEFKRLKINKFTGKRELVWVCPSGNNHAWDCECMQVMTASILGALPDIIVREEEKLERAA